MQRGFWDRVDHSFDYDTSWTPDHFKDGGFVRLSGRVRLTDYSRSIAAMDAFPTLFKAFKTVQMGNIKTAADSDAISAEDAAQQRRDLETMDREIRAFPIQHISTLGQTLYSAGSVRVKVQADGAPTGFIFAGSGAVEYILDGLGAGGVSESPSASTWVVVGQTVGADKEGGSAPMPTGNGLEDAVERVSDAFRGLVNVGSSAVFPAIALTPLAIYREVH